MGVGAILSILFFVSVLSNTVWILLMILTCAAGYFYQVKCNGAAAAGEPSGAGGGNGQGFDPV